MVQQGESPKKIFILTSLVELGIELTLYDDEFDCMVGFSQQMPAKKVETVRGMSELLAGELFNA